MPLQFLPLPFLTRQLAPGHVTLGHVAPRPLRLASRGESACCDPIANRLPGRIAGRTATGHNWGSHGSLRRHRSALARENSPQS
ncbi:MAG: hypothetical protein ACKOJF_04705, partial [Planctomycetaceae bacterium]